MNMRLTTVRFNRTYQKLLLWGHRAGCHQRPDRSFFWHGYQFPVCARCTGVLLSYLISIPIYLWLGSGWNVCLPAMAVMLIDWLIQYVGIRESTNFRRFLTGICGGYGIMTAQILLVKQLINLLKERAMYQ